MIRFAFLLALAGCYHDVTHTIVQVRWHRAPVACLDTGEPLPARPADRYCGVDLDCAREEADKWAEYGRAAFLFIHLQVEPLCYEAAGRAGGPR